MTADVAAFCFERLPGATFKATLKGPFLEIEARRDDGLLVGGGGVRCEALSDGSPCQALVEYELWKVNPKMFT
jgi:hypothetical protein